MFDQLKKTFPHLESKLDKYATLSKCIQVPARTVLLREGQISRRSFYIREGCLRVYFNHHGRDITFQFCFEGQAISSAESFFKQIPSIFTIEAIEPSEINVIEKTSFDLMIRELGHDPLVLREAVNALFERQLHYMREFLSFIRDTPEQRYRNLLKDRPHWIQRIPQHYIASYLGITPVHLSRIRNKLVKAGRL